jgi:hypothetical protein
MTLRKNQYNNTNATLKTFEDDFADGLVRLDAGVGEAQILGGDTPFGGGEGGVDESIIDKFRYLLKDAMLLDHVGGLE